MTIIMNDLINAVLPSAQCTHAHTYTHTHTHATYIDDIS